MKDLGIDRNMRTHRIAISGTNYKPLDNQFQIKEALEAMCELVNNQVYVFAKALLVLAIISYKKPLLMAIKDRQESSAMQYLSVTIIALFHSVLSTQSNTKKQCLFSMSKIISCLLKIFL